MSVSIRTHMWMHWGNIAIEHEALARMARKRAVAAACRDDAGLGDELGREMRASMVAISGAAHALDALWGGLAEVVNQSLIVAGQEVPDFLVKKRNEERGGGPRHHMILETLKLGFDLGKLAHEWLREFDWLDELRDAALHAKEASYAPTVHPVGQGTSREMATYSFENAEHAVNLLLNVLETCIAKPKRNMELVVGWASVSRSTVQRLGGDRARQYATT